VTALHGRAIVVLAAQPGRRERDARGVADELRSVLERVAGEGTVTIVVGPTCHRPDAYAAAHAAARRTLDLMLNLGRSGTVIGTLELGPYGLLLEASSRDKLENFASAALSPIVEHDREHGADLLTTLRVYLEEDRSQRRTAARCFVHVNTVVYRVNRIEQLLGRSLHDPATVFDLTLALRIRDVIDSGATPASR